jgi:hypothetical protein
MSTGMNFFISILQLLFILSAIASSLSMGALFWKTSPPFRGKLSRQQFTAVMRIQTTTCLLWVGFLVCNLMTREGSMRLFSGFAAFCFLALAWLSTRTPLIRRLFRKKTSPGERSTAFHLNN